MTATAPIAVSAAASCSAMLLFLAVLRARALGSAMCAEPAHWLSKEPAVTRRSSQSLAALDQVTVDCGGGCSPVTTTVHKHGGTGVPTDCVNELHSHVSLRYLCGETRRRRRRRTCCQDVSACLPAECKYRSVRGGRRWLLSAHRQWLTLGAAHLTSLTCAPGTRKEEEVLLPVR